MEHRSGLIVKATVTPADGYGERDAALVMIAGLRNRHAAARVGAPCSGRRVFGAKRKCATEGIPSHSVPS
jgi:hypothetical protein